MVIKKYKFGEIVVRIESPVNFDDINRYCDYVTDSEKTDYNISIELVKDISEEIDKPFYSTEFADYVKKGKEVYCYCLDGDTDEKYYAYSVTTSDNNSSKIFLTERKKYLLTSVVIFNIVTFTEITAKNNAGIFHSSYINLNGNAVLFTGPCGMGKSTQADLWAKYNSTEIVNGDKVLLYEKNGVYMAGALPICGTSQFCVKKDMPIKAVVVLTQAPYNAIERLKGMNAFTSVLKSIYPVKYMSELMEKQMNFAEGLAGNVPVFHLACMPNEEAVRCLEDELNAI